MNVCMFTICKQHEPPALPVSYLALFNSCSRNHWEGQVLAVLALDRGDKSLSTPEDSLRVCKLGTSLSRPCHTLPCRSSLIGLAMWRIQPTYVTTRRALDASRFWKKTGRENCIMEGQKKKDGTERRYFKICKTKIVFFLYFWGSGKISLVRSWFRDKSVLAQISFCWHVQN